MVRLYQRREAMKAGSAVAVHLPTPELAPRVFEQAAAHGEDVTVLINHVERVAEEFCDQVRAQLPAGPAWRSDDVVSTLSAPQSGIGFHAGHEDGFVVQLAGSRRWRVWHRCVLKSNYLRFLLGEGLNEYEVVPERPESAPLIDTELRPGDILYIPAEFPHEGITLEESISMSIAWRGFSPFTLIRRYYGTEVLSEMEQRAKVNMHYFDLLPDPPPELSDIPSYLVARVCERVDIAEIGLNEKALCARIERRYASLGTI